MNKAIDLLNKHVFRRRLCICGARPPPRSRCSSTTGARPRRSCNRRRCRPSFGTDVRMRCRGPTFVRGAALGVPPLRRNHLSLRVRHRGQNVAKAPRASHPARAAAKLLSLRGGRHSSLGRKAGQRPYRRSLVELAPSCDPRRGRRVHGQQRPAEKCSWRRRRPIQERRSRRCCSEPISRAISIVGDVMCSSTASTLGGRVSANAIGT